MSSLRTWWSGQSTTVKVGFLSLIATICGVLVATLPLVTGGNPSDATVKQKIGDINIKGSGNVVTQSAGSVETGKRADAETLTAVFAEKDPGRLYSLAFQADPGLPRESDGWRELNDRGGGDPRGPWGLQHYAGERF